MRTLVLNADYDFLGIVSYHRGICLSLDNKVTVLAEYDKPIRSPSVTLQAPAVVVVKRYIPLRRTERSFAPSTRNILIRDNFECQYCGCRLNMMSGTKDHVIPMAQGGGTKLTNLVACCKPCNAKKADRTPEQSGMFPNKDPKNLTNEEKIKCMLKTVKSSEKKVWFQCLDDMNVSLFRGI